MTPIFQYDPEKALAAGESNFITESGAYKGKITTAKWTRAKNSNAEALELSFEDNDGRKANYINIWYRKQDGTASPFGENHIQAIMGLTKTQQLSSVQQGNDYICPELTNKPIGLILQKVLTSKQDGGDSYKLDLVLAFGANTGKTLKEATLGEPAETVTKIAANLKDKDERNRSPHAVPLPPQQRQHNAPVAPIDDDFDDIPL
ncbi:hypothetical protein [Wielerella bovis]|uniref:hypothetical protein n=1 Tax=Wielerella bovis TaxID=2917790 RepID=UPI0020193A00|nr:hypothetical protein [Wielerella bovis]ULJ66207.1 hypothetical protein MIS31_07975 [Wielerella bovis]